MNFWGFVWYDSKKSVVFREADQLPQEVSTVVVHDNKTRLFNGVAVEGLVKIEQVTQTESSKHAKCHAEKE